LEDPGTWPSRITEVVGPIAEDLGGSTSEVLDLDVDGTATALIHAALQGTRWRVYHCTRLLAHERDDLLRRGLAPTTQELLERKLRAAVEHGYLPETEADAIRAASILTSSRHQRRAREGRVCALTTRDSLADYHGLWRFFENWGGELVHFSQPDQSSRRLQRLGVPSIVVLDVLLDAPPTSGWYPPMERLLVASFLEMGGLRGETNQRPSSAWPVKDVWQPGHPDYDEQAWLPR
jgi:hypothetical protein